MKKWMSLLLALVMLCPAFPAFGESSAFCAGARQWIAELDPRSNDYTATLSLLGETLGRSILRADEGMTELRIQLPGEPAEEGGEPAFMDAALLQRSEEGLAVQIGDLVYQVDIDDILALLKRNREISPASVREDAASIKALALKAVMGLLQPEITAHPESGAKLIRISVTEKELAERMPAFLDSLSVDEATVNDLLLRYSAAICSVFPDFPLSLTKLREAWDRFSADGGAALPAISLKAEATVQLPLGGKPLQAGATGCLAVNDHFANFSLAILPSQQRGRIISGNVNGVFLGAAFDPALFIRRLPGRLEAVLSLNGNDAAVWELNAQKESDSLDVVLSRTAGYSTEALHLACVYPDQDGDLSCILESSSLDLRSPGSEPSVRTLLSLSATLEAQGVFGVLRIADSQSIRFSLAGGDLYHHIQLSYSDGFSLTDADIWLFSQGNNSWRYRVEIHGDSRWARADRMLISGTFSPDHLDLTVSPLLGDPILTAVADLAKDEGGLSLSASLDANLAAGKLVMNGMLSTNAGRVPVFLDAEAYLTVSSGSVSVYRLSWEPGKLSFVDNANFYELIRTEGTASTLTYELTRNRTVPIYSFVSVIGEDGTLSAALSADGSESPVAELTVSAAPSEASSPDAPKITPIDTSRAVQFGLNTFLRIRSFFSGI